MWLLHLGNAPSSVAFRVRFGAMLTRAAWHPSAPRYVLGVLAVSWSILAVGTSQLPYLSFMAWAWGGIYLVAAVLCIWCAIDFESPRAVAFAGAGTVVANFMRGALLIAAWIDDDPALRGFDRLSLLGGVTAWWTLAFLSAVLFFRRVAPLASAERLRT